MKKIDKEVMGGWPIHAQTLREILIQLGFEEDEGNPGNFWIENNDDILDAYPVTLEDDGMGYGVKPLYITEADHNVYKDETLKENVFNLFRNGYRLTNQESNY